MFEQLCKKIESVMRDRLIFSCPQQLYVAHLNSSVILRIYTTQTVRSLSYPSICLILIIRELFDVVAGKADFLVERGQKLPP